MKRIYFIIALLSLVGCKNWAYKTVATDVDRTPKHEQILANLCASEFPVKQTFVKGKDSIITITNTQTDTITDTLTQIKTVFKTVIELKTVVRVDTFTKETQYNTVAYKREIADLKAQNTELLIQNGTQKNELSEEKRKYRISFGISLLLAGILCTFILIKLK